MDWSGINDKIFEKLACDYANDVYKKYKWVPTGKSWDGNRDAEFREKIESLNYYYKGWCEAKYTQNPQQAIPKSHMDSTLVSGVLDGEVIFILFVTNGKITSDFIQRATAILEPHKIQVKFVDGSILSDWIKTQPSVIDKYFKGVKFDSTSINLKIELKDVCFLDAILSAPSLISPQLKLKVNKEYFLYLNIFSNQKAFISLDLNTRAIKVIPQEYTEYNIVPGYNSFLIRCIAKYPHNDRIELFILNDDKVALKAKIPDLLIEEDQSPTIVYTQQQEIQQNIFNCIENKFTNNMLLHLFGSEGSGKSYLLQQLVMSISDRYNQILTLSFSEKDAENASSLCKLILFINFGYLYDLSEEAFIQLVKNNTNFPFEIFLELKEGTQNQITAINVIDKISTMIKENPCALFPNTNSFLYRNTSFIVADDFHKISKKHSFLCKKIIEEFVTRTNSTMFIVCNRPNEFYSTELENAVKKMRIGKWNLSGISVNDVYSSIKINFNQEIAGLTDFFPLPVSVLHLELLIKKLLDKNIVLFSKEKRGSIFSEAYEETNITNNQFAVNKVRNCKYLKILYIVYKIESGVPTSFLNSFYKQEYINVSRNFVKDTLIKEENGILKPYHDIYLYAFSQIQFDSIYMEELNSFLQFCISRKIESSVLVSNILSILIDRKNITRNNYLNMAKTICADYYSKSQYIAAQNLAIVLLPDLDCTPYSQYTYENLELLYIFAQSKKYSQTHLGSSKYLQLISDIGGVIPLNSKQKGIVQEAHSELITNYLYSLDFEKFEKELIYFENHLKGKTDICSSEHKINAYLNFLNRKILFAFFTDDNNLEDKYKEAYNESIHLNRDDYQAYADMDYAKIILFENNEKALDLFKKALPIFQKYGKCEKRRVDCISEIVFLNHLMSNISYDRLYNLQKEALENKYIHVYARLTLTILSLELVDGEDPEDIEMKLTKLLIDYSDLNNSNRLGLFVNQLFTAIYFKKGDLQKQHQYAIKHQNIAKKLSKTYLAVPIHNQNKFDSNTISWYFNGKSNIQDSLWLDPRIW